MSAGGDRLDSWKEIAAFLGRSVRTVRRWEAQEGLPVHRHMHLTQGTVYAYRSEIEAWRSGERRARPEPAGARSSPAKSVAVLPFADLSDRADPDYFAEGLTDEVIADLSKVHSLRVTSRTSSVAFRETRKDARTIAGELGVRFLVEGTVRRASGRIRVTARLIDAEADSHLWADKYDGTLEDIFRIQAELARVIADALEVRLSADEDRRLGARRDGDLRAYECLLQARQEALRWRPDSIDRARVLLRNGLELVGDHAELWAALGRVWLQYREAGVEFGEGPLVEAERCAERVLTLDPRSASGIQLRGWIAYSRGRIPEAVRDLEAALEISPNDPDTLGLLANCELISGRVREARPLIDRLLAVDPLTPLNRCLPGWADILEGRFATAVAPYRQMLEMDPGNPMARLFYVWVLILNGRHDAVLEAVQGFPPEVRDGVPARIALFLARAGAGAGSDAVAALTPEIEVVAAATDFFPRFLAQGYALAGLAEPAIRWLEIAVDRGFANHPFLSRHDPCLHSLRGRPELERLLERVRERSRSLEP